MNLITTATSPFQIFYSKVVIFCMTTLFMLPSIAAFTLQHQPFFNATALTIDIDIQDCVIAVLPPCLLSCEGLHDSSLHAILRHPQIRLHVCLAKWIRSSLLHKLWAMAIANSPQSLEPDCFCTFTYLYCT